MSLVVVEMFDARLVVAKVSANDPIAPTARMFEKVARPVASVVAVMVVDVPWTSAGSDAFGPVDGFTIVTDTVTPDSGTFVVPLRSWTVGVKVVLFAFDDGTLPSWRLSTV